MSFVSPNKLFTLALRIGIGGLFIWAGWAKMQNPQAFADSIAMFQLLPNALVNVLALGLPAFEILVGASLVVGWQRRAAALGTVILTSIFLVALIQGMIRGLQIDCGCFGNESPLESSNWFLVIRDLVLLGATLFLYKF